jgi:hypothetical protein
MRAMTITSLGPIASSRPQTPHCLATSRRKIDVFEPRSMPWGQTKPAGASGGSGK